MYDLFSEVCYGRVTVAELLYQELMIRMRQTFRRLIMNVRQNRTRYVEEQQKVKEVEVQEQIDARTERKRELEQLKKKQRGFQNG